jgi:hypothetical protein
MLMNLHHGRFYSYVLLNHCCLDVLCLTQENTVDLNSMGRVPSALGQLLGENI